MYILYMFIYDLRLMYLNHNPEMMFPYPPPNAL